MKVRLSLRLRTALFFAALAGLAIASHVAGGFLAARQGVDVDILIGAGLFTAIGIVISCTLIGFLFDENVARPIDALAAALRARAHGGVNAPLDARTAKHLADLAPAAGAVCERLAELDRGIAARVEEETAALRAEKEQLSAILSEVPVAVLAVDRSNRITLYDRQCVHALGGVATLALGRSVFRYLDEADLREATQRLAQSEKRYLDNEIKLADGSGSVKARMRQIGTNRGIMLAMEVDEDVVAERPIVFDFALIDRAQRGAVPDLPLSALPFVVFDTETTGLEPKTDEIVQIGAVRTLNGRLVDGETYDTLVDPGRPIPPIASRVHGITAEHVRGAPAPADAVEDFHRYARGETLVAHNAPFDLQFLDRHAKTRDIAFDAPVLDTVLLSAVLFGEGGDHTLDGIAERLGVTIEGAARHTAMGDAIATAQVLLKMIPILEAKGITTLGDAIDAMRRHQKMMPASASLFRAA